MFILEDGTGVPGANALVSVNEFYNYANSRGISIDETPSKDLQSAIVIASADYISTYYCFKGEKLNEDQGMSIPTDEVSINADIKAATCSAVILSMDGKLFVPSSDISSSGTIKSESKSVSTLSKSVEYFENKAYTTTFPTPTVDRLLQPYLCPNGGYGAPTNTLRY